MGTSLSFGFLLHFDLVADFLRQLLVANFAKWLSFVGKWLFSSQGFVAPIAAEMVGMIHATFVVDVRSFDELVTRGTHFTEQLMKVSVAIGIATMLKEFRPREWLLAGEAHEVLWMPNLSHSCQCTAHDGLVAVGTS